MYILLIVFKSLNARLIMFYRASSKIRWTILNAFIQISIVKNLVKYQ